MAALLLLKTAMLTVANHSFGSPSPTPVDARSAHRLSAGTTPLFWRASSFRDGGPLAFRILQ